MIGKLRFIKDGDKVRYIGKEYKFPCDVGVITCAEIVEDERCIASVMVRFVDGINMRLPINDLEWIDSQIK